MSRRFEESITEWYEHSRTADLKYLDLASSQSSIRNSELSHNIDVIYDRVCLLSRVTIKDHCKTHEALKQISQENLAFRERVFREFHRLKTQQESVLRELAALNPLTRSEATALILQLFSQPKEVEEEAVRLLKEVKEHLHQVEDLIHQVRRLIA